MKTSPGHWDKLQAVLEIAEAGHVNVTLTTDELRNLMQDVQDLVLSEAQKDRRIAELAEQQVVELKAQSVELSSIDAKLSMLAADMQNMADATRRIALALEKLVGG